MHNTTIIGNAANFNIGFRSLRLSSHAGSVLLKDFVDRLGLADLLATELHVKQRQRGYSDAEALLALTFTLILGGACLSDLRVLRGDPGTLQLLDCETVLAPSTAGEYLRKFTLGDVADLQRGLRLLARRLRPQQTSKTCTIDLDASVYEQCSTRKEGSCRAYNGQVGYHPLFAFWAEEGELLASHLQAGKRHPASKAEWFLTQVRHTLPANKAVKLRADSAFYSWSLISELERHDIIYAITADLTKYLKAQIESLDESHWRRYGKDAEVAELRYAPGRQKERRYVIKRVWLKRQRGQPGYRYHAVVTNEEKKKAAKVMSWALQRCNMENLIKEHKSGFGLEKLPTQKFVANWAWLLIGQLAYNLVAWFKRLVLPEAYETMTIKTLRYRLLNLAGKLVSSGRQWYLWLSDDYAYQEVWRYALKQLAKLAT